MKEEKNKNIDDVFKRVISNPANEPEYREDHWDAMQEMLNGKKKPGKMVYWLPLIGAAAMVLVALGWWYLTPRIEQNDKPKQQVVIMKPTENGARQHSAVAGPSKEDPIIAKNGGVTDMSTRYFDKPNLGTADKSVRGSSPANVIPGGKVNSDEQMAGNVSSGNHDATAALLERPKPFTLPDAGLANHNIKAVDLPNNVVKNDPVAISDKVKGESWLKKTRLAIAVLSSADINGVNSFNNTSTGKNIGMLVSARFGKLSISTGAHYSVKPYSMPFSAYSPTSAYKFKYAPETVTADCRMLDIPLNIDYQVFSKNKNSISVGTGVSSFIMLKESYQYNYATSHVYGLSSYNVSNPDKYLFSSINFQANYQRQINSKIGVNLMPYVKVPLNDIGYSRVKLQTVGVAVGINWNINSLPKPK